MELPKFIRLMQSDPRYDGCLCPVAVSVDHIVRVVPLWYTKGENGEKFKTQVTDPRAVEYDGVTGKDFAVFDSAGNTYSSANASKETVRVLNEIWRSTEQIDPNPFTINLKDPAEFTIKNVRKLIALTDDSTHTQIRVTQDGIAFASKTVGSVDTDGLLCRFGTAMAGGGYFGPEAAEDDEWVNHLYTGLKNNWPIPSSTFIETY